MPMQLKKEGEGVAQFLFVRIFVMHLLCMFGYWCGLFLLCFFVCLCVSFLEWVGGGVICYFELPIGILCLHSMSMFPAYCWILLRLF